MGTLRGKKGFVLMVSVITLLSVSIIAAAFVYMVTVRTRAAAGALDYSKAFWLAEAGIQQFIARVTTDSAYRDSPAALSGSLGSGTYSLSVVKQAGQTVYNLTSTGTVGGISRQVMQTVTFVTAGWPQAFTDYGVFTRSGGVVMSNSALISGDVYTLGTVTTSGKSKVTGIVYANSGVGNYTRLPLPVPPLSVPSLSTTYYNNLINTAKAQPAGNKTYTTLALAGGTVYVNGTVTANNITGPGVIVSTGNFTVGGGTVGQNVTIITNATLGFLQNSVVQPNCILYSSSSISFANSGVNITNSSVITPGTISVMSDITCTGAVYCGGNLTLSGKSAINMSGAMVSGGTVTMGKADHVAQSKAQLPTQVPNGIAAVAGVTLSNWQSA